MKLSELYLKIGGDYEDVLDRFRTEERVEKFVKMFLSEDSYENFVKSMEAGNWDDAFRFVHTLKGVALNLSFDGLSVAASRVTEALRAGEVDGAKNFAPELEDSYKLHFEEIQSYFA